MNLTLSDLIKHSLMDIGVIGQDETPPDSIMTKARQTFTMMLAQLGARGNMIRAATTEYTTLSASAQSITIGPSGATWTTAKPIRILNAFIRDTDNNDYPVDVMTLNFYNSLTDKATTNGRPSVIAYDPGAAQQAAHKGTIYIYPKPDVATYKLYIEAQKAFSEISNLTDTVTFEPMYQEPLKYLLDIRLWRQYHDDNEPVPADIIALAKAGVDTLTNINVVIPMAKLDKASGGRYDIFTDD